MCVGGQNSIWGRKAADSKVICLNQATMLSDVSRGRTISRGPSDAPSPLMSARPVNLQISSGGRPIAPAKGGRTRAAPVCARKFHRDRCWPTNLHSVSSRMRAGRICERAKLFSVDSFSVLRLDRVQSLLDSSQRQRGARTSAARPERHAPPASSCQAGARRDGEIRLD